MAGLTAARTLQAAGANVQVLDKGRGVGGRMATRRFETGVFDHGAQFFTVRDAEFRKTVQSLEERGVVRSWSRGFPEAGGVRKDSEHLRYRGHPGMTALPKALAQGLDVRLNTRLRMVDLRDGRWQATSESGQVHLGDALLLTPPVPQSLELMARGAVQLPGAVGAQLRAIRYHRCIALLVLLEQPGHVPPPGGVRVPTGAIRWIADNQQKGISPQAAAVTIHAAPDFSRQYWDAQDGEIADRLLSEAAPWIQSPLRSYQVHRWRYSQPVAELPVKGIVVPGPPVLAFAGDAFGGGRVEGAALSGQYAAERLIGES